MNSYKYDVAISYASENYPLVNLVYKLLTTEGISVFFAPAKQHDIVGHSLTERLHQLYGKEARFVAAFVSEDYVKKPVPMHEARSAMIRNLDGDYCLIPIYLDSTTLPFLDPDIAYYKENDPYMIKHLIARMVHDAKPGGHPEKTAADSKVHIGKSIHIGEISGGNVQL